MRTLLIFLALTATCFAELTVKQTPCLVFDTDAKALDGVVVVPVTANLVAKPAIALELSGVNPEAFVRIKAKTFVVSQVNGVFVVKSKSAQIKKFNENTWLMYGDPGAYSVVIDVAGSGTIDGLELEDVVLSPASPAPDTEVELQGLSAEVRKATKEYLNNMANDYAKLSSDASAKTVKTVLEASTVANKYDEATRKSFKQRMGELMAPKLGVDALPSDAPQTFLDISKGFKVK